MDSNDRPIFEIMTSMRSDGLLLENAHNAQLRISNQVGRCQFYMLRYHLDRMVAAAHEFGWIETARFLESHMPNVLDEELKRHLSDEYGNPNYPDPLKVIFLSYA